MYLVWSALRTNQTYRSPSPVAVTVLRAMVPLATLADLGWVTMLTDSRSFLSYPRHEYFRRILCNLLGEWVENGEFPCDVEALAQLVADICYNNTKSYFGF